MSSTKVIDSLTPEEIAYYQAHADDDLRPNQLAAGVVGIVLALTAVTTRTVARFCSKTRFGWDDYLIFVALIGQFSYAVLMFMNVANGQGQHILFLKNQTLFSQLFVAAIIVYSITVMLTKLSILFLYRRAFPIKWLLIVSYLLGAVVIAYNLSVIFVASFKCIPLSVFWTGNSKKCVDNPPPFAVFNVITDFAILALPIQPVLGLRMRRTRKMQVLTIFLLGGIVCIFGIIRSVAIATMKPVDISCTAPYPIPTHDISLYTKPLLSGLLDNSVRSTLWSYIELSAGILAACMPTFGPLLQHRRRNRATEPYNSGSSGSRSNVRWKLGIERLREVREDDSILLTEGSGLGERDHSAWLGEDEAEEERSRSGDVNHDVEMRSFSHRHPEGKDGGEEEKGGIVVQKEVRQNVDSV
ncbi:uncharacterized protein LDX57_001893 [Aspergillus melleus]|uniref:uncharacterized protein n=1 Tax=Aspergillus melleus TaxID=138277 RepID=UPI001E8DFEF9|nr:uncharacterized protein LDX57_001893 [Aspergillus melleus]KAH8424139.1 hypothetical protein LDX57_001893 [Aspergillus melleus]